MIPASPPQDEADIALLNGLARVHLLFGMNVTALSFLELCDWIKPNRIETLRLMSKANFSLKNSLAVLDTLAQVEGLSGASGLLEEDIVLKARSLAMVGRTQEARNELLLI